MGGHLPSLREARGKEGPGVWGGQRAVKLAPGPAQPGNERKRVEQREHGSMLCADPRSQGLFTSPLKRVDFTLGAQ